MPGEQTRKELLLIDFLLRSKVFSFEMAGELYAAYKGGGHTPFITTDEATANINKTGREEKIATSLAGFYAVECGVGLLCEQTSLMPVEWLQIIADKSADANATLLMNCFANATWKACQPFKGLDRITRYNFTGAGYLSAGEIEKDFNQVTAAASMLLTYMQQVARSPLREQMERLKDLLQDTRFAIEMSQHIDSSYHTSQHLPVPSFFSEEDDTTIISKSLREQKIATNIAAFYALECGINYLVTTNELAPTDILRSIISDSIPEIDKTLFLRLANATWKAGQPFIDLNNITRDTFTPAWFLSPEEIDKDLVQITAAARKLLITLEGSDH